MPGHYKNKKNYKKIKRKTPYYLYRNLRNRKADRFRRRKRLDKGLSSFGDYASWKKDKKYLKPRGIKYREYIRGPPKIKHDTRTKAAASRLTQRYLARRKNRAALKFQNLFRGWRDYIVAKTGRSAMRALRGDSIPRYDPATNYANVKWARSRLGI